MPTSSIAETAATSTPVPDAVLAAVLDDAFPTLDVQAAMNAAVVDTPWGLKMFFHAVALYFSVVNPTYWFILDTSARLGIPRGIIFGRIVDAFTRRSGAPSSYRRNLNEYPDDYRELSRLQTASAQAFARGRIGDVVAMSREAAVLVSKRSHLTEAA